LIVCEGETERYYFEALRVRLDLSNAEVQVPPKPTGRSPRQLVEYADSQAKKSGGYDRIYCVFDRDTHDTFAEARQRIRDLARRSRNPLPISEAVSIPCWEVWVLLHFAQSDRPFTDAAQVVDAVYVAATLIYGKADARVAKQLLDHLEEALKNADWLERRTGRTDENPSTSVHYVVRHLQDVAASADRS
jgi:hypothetical protein